MRNRVISDRWRRHGVAILAVSGLAAVTGPFETSIALAFAPRLLYWLGMISLAWGQWLLLTGLLHRVTRANPWPAGAVGTVASFFFAALMALEIIWIHRWLPALRVPAAAATFLWVVGIMLSVCWLTQLLLRMIPAGATAPAMSPGSAGDVRFLRRISRRIAGELLCLKTEDHYLRIFTAQDTDLILFRLKDALTELEGADGMQVHRSYWVARNAVQRVERKGRKTTLILSNGLHVPVSESFLPAVRKAGWLD